MGKILTKLDMEKILRTRITSKKILMKKIKLQTITNKLTTSK